MATSPKPPLLAAPVKIQLAICAEIVDSFHYDCIRTPPTRHGTPARPGPTPTWKDTLENFAALGSLARTCKHFEQLATPMLFERVKVSVFSPIAFVQIIRHLSRFSHLAACSYPVMSRHATRQPCQREIFYIAKRSGFLRS